MSFGTLALIVAIGLVGPLLTTLPTRFAPPIVIGEIAAGVVLGQTGTKTIDPTEPTLAFLASIGFALLMFIVATRLPLRHTDLRGVAVKGLWATGLTVALSIALSPLVATLTDVHRPGVIAVLLASSSAAIVLPIIGPGRSQPVLVTIAWVSFADIVTVLAVPFVLRTGSFGRTTLGALLIVSGAAVFGFVIHRLIGLSAVETLRHESHRRDWALDLRLSLLVLFTLAWIAERFDTSVLFAGFAAGVMVSLIGEPRRVADQLIGLGEGFFVPLFFVVLGAHIDLRALVHSRDDLVLFAVLSAGTTLVPVVVAALVRLPLWSGLLAAAELGVPAAIAAVGLANKALTPGQAAAVVGTAAFSLAVATVGESLRESSARVRREPDGAA
jgi:Kef-type K+ transport system membrane component KefB